MRVLVTGASGFVGRYLVQELVNRGHQVFVALRKSKGIFNNPVNEFEFNLMDRYSLDHLIKEIQPNGVIHLAAQSKVKVAWEEPAETLTINTVGTINLVDALNKLDTKVKIITVGSSEEYGLTGKLGEALTEEHPCLPQNPYATSKLAMGLLSLQLARKNNMNIIHARPFNHFGPGQQEGFVVSDFSSQVASVENFLKPPIIKVGDLSAKRDFTDVRDVVDAYILLLEKNVESGIYNICSGVPRSADEIMHVLLEEANILIDIQIDHERFRPSEVPIFIGSARKLEQTTGWKPRRNFKNSLIETLNWWRKQILKT